MEVLAGAPRFVSGVSVVRGEPIAVLDLAYLLAGRSSDAVRRLVVLRAGERRVALAVDGVAGTSDMDPGRLHSLPSLIGDAPSEIAKAVGRIDQRLFTSLQAGRVLVDQAWQAMETKGGEEPR